MMGLTSYLTGMVLKIDELNLPVQPWTKPKSDSVLFMDSTIAKTANQIGLIGY